MCVCVCVGGGGGGYKKRFTVPGLKTTNDVTQKHKGVKITKLGKTIATKLSKTSPIFTPRITPLFSITYLWLFRSFFQFFFQREKNSFPMTKQVYFQNLA